MNKKDVAYRGQYNKKYIYIFCSEYNIKIIYHNLYSTYLNKFSNQHVFFQKNEVPKKKQEKLLNTKS